MSPMRWSKEFSIGVACALAVVIIFTSFTLLSRIGVRSTLGVPDIAALRFGIGGLLLLPVFLRYKLAGVELAQALALTVTGGLGFALSVYSGLALAPASHGAVFLHGTLPFFAAVLSGFMLAELPNRRGYVGLALILIGVCAMALDSFRGAGARQLLGDLCLLMSSVCWSTYSILVRRYKVTAWHSASIVAFFSMLIYLPIYAVFLEKKLFSAEISDILIQGSYQGIVIGVLSILIYTRAVNSLGAAQAALFTAAVPCLTTLIAIPLLGETPTQVAVTGLFIVSIGMVLAIQGMIVPITGRKPSHHLAQG